jgi:mannose-6-phosphate isomerase-like protein (cupin superfamily)
VLLIIEGGLVIEFEHGEIQLAGGQMTAIPRGLRHRTRPVGRRSVNLTFEAANSETTI